MAITHKERMTACGVNTGLFEREQEPMICCPELDHHNSGRPNLPLASCLYKQRDHVNRISTCYKGCKGKLPNPQKFTAPLMKKHIKVSEDEEMTAKIIELYQGGATIKEITEEVNKGKELVSGRLINAGVKPKYFIRDINSLKQRVYRFLDGYPEATIVDIQRNFPDGKQITLERYKTQWAVDRKITRN